MGGSLAICNKTTIPAVVVLRGQDGRMKLSRTCQPDALCAFDNIRAVEYILEVMMDNKLVLQTKCKANGCLYNFSEAFKLECDEATRILWVKKSAPIGMHFEGGRITELSRTRRVQAFQLGWQVTQIGHITSAEWQHLQRKGSFPVLSIIFDTFGGDVVLVFRTTNENSLGSLEKTEENGEDPDSTGNNKEQNSKLALSKGTDEWSQKSGKGRYSPSKLRLPRWTNPFKTSLKRRKNTDYSFALIKEWIVLHEAHKELIKKDQASIRNLVCKLATVFEEARHKVVKDDESSIERESNAQNGPIASQESPKEVAGVSWLVRESLLDAVDINTLIRKKKSLQATMTSLEDSHRQKDRQESWSVLQSGADIPSLEDHSNEELSAKEIELICSREQPLLEEASTDKECVDTTKHIQAPELQEISTKRIFEYPFFETVSRLAKLGLELRELEPTEFLEHEVHYVQASLAAQSVISGEPYVLDCAGNGSPGWSAVYTHGILKFYWIRDCNGIVSLDPPSEDFWVLLANPLEPLNPFPYPRTEETLS